MPLNAIPIAEQITEVKREIALRERVYPAWVRQGKMKQDQCDQLMARMQAVLSTLLILQGRRADYSQENLEQTLDQLEDREGEYR